MSRKAQINPDLRIFRIASLILANAMLFQEVIARSESGVKTLRKTLESSDLMDEFSKQWKFIQQNVDFIPIFNVAHEILLRLPSSPQAEEALRDLADSATKISANRAALRHDLMGRIFHKLLADAKFFGAFYTKIPSATMLLKLTVDLYDQSVDWSKVESLGAIKVGDLACGTGTLLKAALGAVEDRYVRSCAAKGEMPKPDQLHKILIENGLWGFDVLASAVHLAGAAIAMHDPNVRLDKMRVYTVPLGGRSQWLGSIEFAKGRKLHIQQRLIGAAIGARSSTAFDEDPEVLSLPVLDICTMNPPFTRSVYGNLLFGSLAEEERSELQSKLQEVVKEKNLDANITAGLGTVFVAIGAKVTRDMGFLALVLPKAVLNGSAWEPTRRIIGKSHLAYVIASHEPDNWNFSESTSLSEVLLVIHKGEGIPTGTPTVFVNLWEQPKTSTEALAVVRAIQNGTPASLNRGIGISEIRTNGHKYGEMVALSIGENKDTSWATPASFAQTDLCRAAYQLSNGSLFIPGQGTVGKIPLIKLGNVAELGPDGRDIYDGFALTGSSTPYPALWGYDSTSILRLKQDPNQHLSPLTKAPRGRKLRDAALLWSRAGTLMLPKELWLTTNRVAAVVLPKRALSNVWWPTRWKTGDEENRRQMERILALWFNSTLGLFTLVMQRQETRGPWCKFPKAWYEELPVLDIASLGKERRDKLNELWDSASSKNFLPIPQMKADTVRGEIDRTFSEVLKIPQIDALREIFAREPIVAIPQ